VELTHIDLAILVPANSFLCTARGLAAFWWQAGVLCFGELLVWA
jgi:hypothetical protein